MIAKITRGTRAGDIAAYLHGPGKTAMHTYRDRDGAEQVGGMFPCAAPRGTGR